MDNKDFSDIGEQIRKTVESALGSQNFEQLNKNISDSVNSALEDVRKSFLNAGGAEKKSSTEKNKDNSAPLEKPSGVRGVPIGNGKRGRIADSGYLPDSVRVNCPSKVPGILYTVFGSIGIGVTALLAIIMLFVSLLVKPILGSVLGGSVFFLLLCIIFSVMLSVGQKSLGRIKRLKTYLRESGEKTYCPLEQLSAAVGKPRRFVLKDLERLIKSGILPEAHLDEKKTCLMLDKATYRQYLDTQKSFAERTQMEADKALRKQAEADKQMTSLSAEVREMVSMGRGYLKTLQEANLAIPGEVISGKLTKLENVIDRIFETVEKHPKRAKGMERFMDYYLPTTVKLVNAYRDFDAVGTEAGNVALAKQEIEDTLDTIIKAFERLLDDLYADAVMDVSTDASVLQTMLRQDGFADSDFKKGEE